MAVAGDQSIYSFLALSSREELSELYALPWCALAVTQSLRSLPRSLLMTLLPHGAPVHRDTLRHWMRPEPEHDEAFRGLLRDLQALHLLHEPATEVAAVTLNGMAKMHEGALVLNATFAASLQAALAGAAQEPWEEHAGHRGGSASASASSASASAAQPPPSAADVQAHASRRWHSILHYLLGSPGTGAPDPNVIVLLVSTGLMQPGNAPEGVVGRRDCAALGRVMCGDAVDAGAGSGSAALLLQGSAGNPLTYKQILAAGGGASHVTKTGFEFLLKDTGIQLWTFMHEYIRSAPARGLRPTEVLSLLFHLGFCRPGHGYPMAALTPKERKLLLDFAAFGLVYIPGLDAAPVAASASASASASAPAEPQLFYPTSLSTLLTQPPDREAEGRASAAAASAAAAGASDAGPAPPPRPVSAALASAAQAVQAASAAPADAQQLRLVVETNFRVYAFTSSLLHIGLLGLFARVDTRLPNLTTATLTRRSVVQANAYGIPAARIAAFLASHSAQPRGSAAAAAAARPALPKNVEEQLLLWELEKRRVSAARAVAIGPCASAGESERLRDIARALGGLLWEGRVGKDGGRTVVVSSACVAELRELARARGLEVEGGQGAGRRGEGSSSSGGGGGGGGGKRARGGWAGEGEEEAEAGAEAEEEEEILQVPD